MSRYYLITALAVILLSLACAGTPSIDSRHLDYRVKEFQERDHQVYLEEGSASLKGEVVNRIQDIKHYVSK